MPTAVFGIEDPQWDTVVVALVTALVTTIAATVIRERARLWTEPRLHRSQADTDYEYEQKKKLRDKIGEYHGRLLEAATNFNYRLANLDLNHPERWHAVNGEFAAPVGEQYYFRTTVYRFMVLAGLSNRFEREALVIDARIAQPTDMAFLFYIKALRWAMTDVALFGGLTYDMSSSTDHLYTDRLRQMCAAVVADGNEITLDEFVAMLRGEHDLVDVLRFFDGIQPGELRWDRLMAYRLLLMAFINTIGYDMQKSPQEWFDWVAGRIQHREVVASLLVWLSKLGLGEDPEAEKVRRALEIRLSSEPAPVSARLRTV